MWRCMRHCLCTERTTGITIIIFRTEEREKEGNGKSENKGKESWKRREIGAKITERGKGNMGRVMGKGMGGTEREVHMDNKEYRKQKTSYANKEGGRVSGRNYLRNQLLRQGEC